MDYDENTYEETPGERLQKELQDQIDTLAEVLAGKDAQLAEMSEQFVVIQRELAIERENVAKANFRIGELSAQITAVAEDALNWVSREEFDEKMALVETYARAQYANRHHSRNFQTFSEWLAAMAPAL
jgi:chromosome segregation ATPase